MTDKYYISYYSIQDSYRTEEQIKEPKQGGQQGKHYQRRNYSLMAKIGLATLKNMN